MTTYATHTFSSIADAAGPLCVKHRRSLRELAEWSLGVGRPIDTDVAAICLEAVEEDFEDEADRTLTRPRVNSIQWASIHNKATGLNVLLPDDWRVHFWTLLSWYSATDRLSPGSDPLAVLLEPLQCYGGLGSNGLPRPEDEDVAFVCQCYIEFDPKLAQGQAKVIIGHDLSEREQLLMTIHPFHRSAEAPASAFRPLLTLARRAGPTTLRVTIDPLEWKFLGRAEATKDSPELWLYSRTTRRHEHPLMLDASGICWTPRIDHRRKLGYVLRPVSVVATLGRAASLEPDDESQP